VPVDVAAPVIPAAAVEGNQPGRVDAGRSIYVSPTKCARCHSPKPVWEYSAEAWTQDILPRMARKARLTPEEQDGLLAYVLAASKVRPR
jgi:hypothetical protein